MLSTFFNVPQYQYQNCIHLKANKRHKPDHFHSIPIQGCTRLSLNLEPLLVKVYGVYALRTTRCGR